MSETNIGPNLPKAHGTQPSFEGEKRAKGETPAPEPNNTTTQKDLNLNEDPAVVGGKSQVKKSAAFKGYPPYDPQRALDDVQSLQLLNSAFDKKFIEQYAKQNGIGVEAAQDAILDSFLPE